MKKQTGNLNESDKYQSSQGSFNQFESNGEESELSGGSGYGSESESGRGQGSSGQSFGQGGSSSMQSGSSNSLEQETGISDLAYDWISFIQCKADAVKSYQQYISDAEQANSMECAEMFREACKADQQQLEQAKQHLSAVLQETM